MRFENFFFCHCGGRVSKIFTCQQFSAPILLSEESKNKDCSDCLWYIVKVPLTPGISSIAEIHEAPRYSLCKKYFVRKC